jgi:hypothetical protein
MTLTTPTLSGTITTNLTASKIIQSNGSSQLTASNTLPSSCSATSMTLTTPTLSGTISTGLTASSIVQTDGSSNLTASNTLVGPILINGSNSTTKFQVQSASSQPIFTVDTTNGKIKGIYNTLDDGSGNCIFGNASGSGTTTTITSKYAAASTGGATQIEIQGYNSTVKSGYVKYNGTDLTLNNSNGSIKTTFGNTLDDNYGNLTTIGNVNVGSRLTVSGPTGLSDNTTISSTKSLLVDTIVATTTNANLNIGANGTGKIYLNTKFDTTMFNAIKMFDRRIGAASTTTYTSTPSFTYNGGTVMIMGFFTAYITASTYVWVDLLLNNVGSGANTVICTSYTCSNYVSSHQTYNFPTVLLNTSSSVALVAGTTYKLLIVSKTNTTIDGNDWMDCTALTLPF